MTSARRVKLAGVRMRMEACRALLLNLLPLSPTSAVRELAIPLVSAIHSNRDLPLGAGGLVFRRGTCGVGVRL